MHIHSRPFTRLFCYFFVLINTKAKRLNQYQFWQITRFKLDLEKLSTFFFFFLYFQIVNLFNHWAGSNSIGLNMQVFSSSFQFQSASSSCVSTWLTSAGTFYIRFEFPFSLSLVFLSADIYFQSFNRMYILTDI